MPGTCTAMDLVSGGGSLPYVYCKNIKIESDTTIKLNLEIYQDKNSLKSSSWLNGLTFEGISVLDYIKIQIVPFLRKQNIQVLEPDYEAGKKSGPGNPYLVSGHPKTKEILQEQNLHSIFPIKTTGGFDFLRPWDTDMFIDPGALTQPVYGHIPSPIQISNSHLTSGILNENYDLLSLEGKQTFSREEVINGKSYYVIPFEYVWEAPGPLSNLGFLFFSFLDISSFFYDLDLTSFDGDLSGIDHGDQVVTGPPTTEIVFKDGKIPQTKKQFLLADGKIWNGAVHLHHCDLNPDPTGYCGDGGLGTPSGTGFRGWMAGDQHKESAPKLKLVEAPNYKIQDFRSTPVVKAETLLGLEYKQNEDTGIWERHLPENERAALRVGMASLMDPHVNPFGFFQKDTRKYLQKYDMPAGTARSNSLYDSDSEFSKLYVSRDKLNNARGLFFIDFERLLNNNSFIYDRLDGSNPDLLAASCLARSRLVELRLYRDRVKKKTLGKNYEKYANDTSYEEPSYLIGTLHDNEDDYGVAHAVEGAITDENKFQEINLYMEHGDSIEGSNAKIRTFAFTDVDVGTKTAGLYQYRVEILFKDGTFEYLNTLLVNLLKAKVELEDYYDFSLGSFNDTGTHEFSYHSVVTTHGANPEIGMKTKIIPYYQNGSFVSEFAVAAQNRFYGENDFRNPWDVGTNGHPTVLRALSKITSVFNDSSFLSFVDTDLAKHLSPMTGSPEGIDLVIKFADSVIKHLQKLVRSNRINKTGSEIDTVTPGPESVGGAYSFTNFFDFVVSPGLAMIKEDHSFDSPLELHKALGNEDIYVDYLSLGSPDTQITTGPIMMSVPAYKNRCQLETLKYSPLAGTSDGFQGNVGGLADGGKILNGKTSLEEAAYTYLSPSIIELSSPESSAQELYDSYISFFDAGAKPDQDASGLQDVTSLQYDKVFIALVNYGLNKAEVDDADLMPDYYKSSISPSETREQYKNLFNLHGVTVHAPNKHASIFDKGSFHNNKSPGAISDQIEYTTKNQFVPEEESFSDILPNGMPLASEAFYKPFFSDPRNIFNTPRGHVLQATEGPNILKLRKHIENQEEPPPINSLFMQSINGTPDGSSPDWNAYYFINTNMISQVQYYDGTPTTHPIPRPLKDDDDGWRPVTKAILGKLPQGKALLCRTVIWLDGATPAKLTYYVGGPTISGAGVEGLQGVRLPVINNYFLLAPSAPGDEAYYSTAAFVLPAIPQPKKLLESVVDFISGQMGLKKQEVLKGNVVRGSLARQGPRRGPTAKIRNEVVEPRPRKVEETQPRKRRSPTRKRRAVEKAKRMQPIVEQVEEITPNRVRSVPGQPTTVPRSGTSTRGTTTPAGNRGGGRGRGETGGGGGYR